MTSGHRSKFIISIISFIAFIFMSNKAYTQVSIDSLKILDAVLLTSDSTLPVKNAHVISKFNHWGTISNKEGRFRMYVDPKDSVLITSVGFRPVILSMDSSYFYEGRVVPIKLIKDTVAINEVVIRGYFDYATMKQIVVEMAPVDLTNFYPNWSGTELLYREAQGSISFKGPIQALYDVFNRSARLQRKLISNRREYNRIMTQMGRLQDTVPAIPEHMQELPR